MESDRDPRGELQLGRQERVVDRRCGLKQRHYVYYAGQKRSNYSRKRVETTEGIQKVALQCTRYQGSIDPMTCTVTSGLNVQF